MLVHMMVLLPCGMFPMKEHCTSSAHLHELPPDAQTCDMATD